MWIRAKKEDSRYEATFRGTRGKGRGLHNFLDEVTVTHKPIEVTDEIGTKLLNNFSGLEEVQDPNK